EQRIHGGTNYEAIASAGTLIERDVGDRNVLGEAKDFPADFVVLYHSHDLPRDFRAATRLPEHELPNQDALTDGIFAFEVSLRHSFIDHGNRHGVGNIALVKAAPLQQSHANRMKIRRPYHLEPTARALGVGKILPPFEQEGRTVRKAF